MQVNLTIASLACKIGAEEAPHHPDARPMRLLGDRLAEAAALCSEAALALTVPTERQVERPSANIIPAGWNYRLVRHGVIIGSPDDTHTEASEFLIHTVEYRAGEAEPWAIRSVPHTPQADTVEELRTELSRMQAACNAPVIEDSGHYLNWISQDPGLYRPL